MMVLSYQEFYSEVQIDELDRCLSRLRKDNYRPEINLPHINDEMLQ